MEKTKTDDSDAEAETSEMRRFWQLKAVNRGPPDPRPIIEQVSTHIVIHKLADTLPAEHARMVQRANFSAFKDLASR